MEILLIIGNITFNGLTKEELSLFKTNSNRKALVHDIDYKVLCSSNKQALKLGEQALQQGAIAYIVPSIYGSDGEIVFENEEDVLTISEESFTSMLAE